MPAPGITVLKHNVPWGPFTREQIEEGLTRGDFTVKYLAHAPGLTEWLPLGEVLDYVDRQTGPRPPTLPPVPGPRELPPVPEPVAPKPAPPNLPIIHSGADQPAPPALPVIHSISDQPAPVPVPPAPARPEPKPASKPEIVLVPASFFLRFFAFLIDCAILFVPVVLLFVLGALAVEVPRFWTHADSETVKQQWEVVTRNTRQLAWLVAIGFGWLYGAGMECSRAQATLGKRWAGIKVTDVRGERISFLRATGRYAAKYLSALPCFLGFMAALFSSRRLALHDRLADTRVVRD